MTQICDIPKAPATETQVECFAKAATHLVRLGASEHCQHFLTLHWTLHEDGTMCHDITVMSTFAHEADRGQKMMMLAKALAEFALATILGDDTIQEVSDAPAH
jgi:hypothetical protein